MVQFIILRGTATIWQIDTIYLAGNVTYCTLITFVKSWFILLSSFFSASDRRNCGYALYLWVQAKSARSVLTWFSEESCSTLKRFKHDVLNPKMTRQKILEKFKIIFINQKSLLFRFHLNDHALRFVHWALSYIPPYNSLCKWSGPFKNNFFWETVTSLLFNFGYIV